MKCICLTSLFVHLNVFTWNRLKVPKKRKLTNLHVGYLYLGPRVDSIIY